MNALSGTGDRRRQHCRGQRYYSGRRLAWGKPAAELLAIAGVGDEWP